VRLDGTTKELDMIALGLILLIIGLVAGIGVLTTIGVILLVIGLILNLVPIGGSTRRVW
jgi:membrane protein implicated in regulation of membrane protease activity